MLAVHKHVQTNTEMNELIIHILKIGGVGCLIFTFFLIVMSFSGIASDMRDKEGKFKKSRNLKTVFGAVFLIAFLMGLLIMGNLHLMESAASSPEFIHLWLNAFGIFLVVHLLDLIVLDYLIIVKWHPAFLKLANT